MVTTWGTFYDYIGAVLGGLLKFAPNESMLCLWCHTNQQPSTEKRVESSLVLYGRRRASAGNLGSAGLGLAMFARAYNAATILSTLMTAGPYGLAVLDVPR